MKNRLYFYPVIRREFGDMRELSEVINRSIRYCQERLNGNRTFTHKERELIAAYIGVNTEEVTK